MPETIVKLLDKTEQSFDHVDSISLAPGFILLLNDAKHPIAVFNATLVAAIVQPANDTDIQIGKLVTQH